MTINFRTPQERDAYRDGYNRGIKEGLKRASLLIQLESSTTEQFEQAMFNNCCEKLKDNIAKE